MAVLRFFYNLEALMRAFFQLFLSTTSLLAAATPLYAAVLISTTDDGRKVILREDGTWKFATQSDLVAVKQLQPNSAQANQSSGVRLTMNSRTTDETDRADFLAVVRGDKSFDIRKAMWGMEKADVKKSENLPLFRETQKTLEYKFSLIGLQSVVVYSFTSDNAGALRLTTAHYQIDQDDVNPARFYEDYKSLKVYLRQVYGFPVSDENVWSNDMYKADEKNWGFAISLGFLSCRASWKNTRTKISLTISGSNHILSTCITYSGAEQ
jgi:hypothetical protein